MLEQHFKIDMIVFKLLSRGMHSTLPCVHRCDKKNKNKKQKQKKVLFRKWMQFQGLGVQKYVFARKWVICFTLFTLKELKITFTSTCNHGCKESVFDPGCLTCCFWCWVSHWVLLILS